MRLSHDDIHREHTAFVLHPIHRMSARRTRSAARRNAPAEASRASPEAPKTPKRRKVSTSAAAPSPSPRGQPAPVGVPPAVNSSPAAASPHAEAVLQAEKTMSDALKHLTFKAPVTHVYNPLQYAWDAHAWYVRRYAKRGVDMLLVGMNPGPWGMAQTGVPFGEVQAVRDFLHMPSETTVGKPDAENAARPVQGLQCVRSEVSGKRLWREWAATEYASADAFFVDYFVHNYCPLMMMEGGGRNRTPVQLKADERAAIHGACDEALRGVAGALRPRAVVGIGGYATERCKAALAGEVEKGLVIATLLHPSPASPLANRGWVGQAVAQMEEIRRTVERSTFAWE